MKVSKKLDNACRVMMQLARADNTHRVTRVEELAANEGVSANFLLQILNDLRRAGLVSSRRGKHGGYILARASVDITLRAIVEAVDGVPMEIDYQADGESGARVGEVWKAVASEFIALLESRTLADMANRGDGAAMFYI